MVAIPERLVDVGAEAATLDSILLRPNQLDAVRLLLEPQAFYDPRHGRIFASILHVADMGQHVDYITVGAELRRRTAGDPSGVADGPADLIKLRTPDVGSAVTYAEIVAELYRRRVLYLELECIMGDLVSGVDLVVVEANLRELA